MTTFSRWGNVEERRLGVTFNILADRKFRKRVFKLCTEQPAKFPSFSSGSRNALREHRDIWQEARMEVYQFPSPASSIVSKREREPMTKTEASKGPAAPGTGKRAKRNTNFRAKIKAPEDQVKSNNRHPSALSSSSEGGVGKGSNKDRPVRPRRVPDQEWQAYTRFRADSKF